MKFKSKFEKIKIQDFINSFGAKKNEFDKKIIKYIKKSNFEYTKIYGKKKLDLIRSNLNWSGFNQRRFKLGGMNCDGI